MAGDVSPVAMLSNCIGKTPNEGHNQIYFEPKEQFAGIVERSISATA